ncbi:Hypothetical predicted protein [Octopus vulgaris]|uniref:Uncharacterized protein n=1 Tax=Octopus vulgaris TaxID=6645 RepID=A0AA36F8J9_OCTVU|nr:Hypothetical predicted protein [Octopus vulgaris]
MLVVGHNVTIATIAQLENIHEADISISDDDLLGNCDHLKSLHDNMRRRYQDLINMEIPDRSFNAQNIPDPKQALYDIQKPSPLPFMHTVFLEDNFALAEVLDNKLELIFSKLNEEKAT